MRLKLLATALVLIGLGAAATGVARGVARAGGVCVLSDQERLSPIKMLKWSAAAAKAGRRPACDLLTYEPRSDDAGTIVFPFLRFRIDSSPVSVVLYILEFKKTGASKVFRQVMGSTEAGKREFGPIEQVWQSKPSARGAAAFDHMMGDLAPLRAVSERKSWKSNFFKPDGQVFDKDKFPSAKERQCDDIIFDHQTQYIGFISLNELKYFEFDNANACKPRYLEATDGRIWNARKSALLLSGFSPPEPEISLP